MNQKANKKFEIVNQSDSVTELFIYDVIDNWWGVSAEEFVEKLNSIESDEIVIRINSPGGDAFDGRAMASAIKQHPAVITAKIDGLCASAATTIANACDHVQMADGSFYMIHRAWTLGWGNRNDLSKTVELLDQLDSAIANDYSKRTGLDKDEIIQMMDDETWMSAEEAKEKGFINEITDDEAVENSFDVSAFDKAPKLKQSDFQPKPVPQNAAMKARLAKMMVAVDNQ